MQNNNNNINESDVDNNTTASLGTVHVDMPSLALDVPQALTLDDGSFHHYRVAVPLGETLRITVSGDEGSLYSELYTSGGQVPTRSSYDEIGAEPYRLNQVALVPETTAEKIGYACGTVIGWGIVLTILGVLVGIPVEGLSW